MHFSIEVVVAAGMEVGSFFPAFFVPVFCFAALGTEFVVCGVTFKLLAAVFARVSFRIGNLFGGILFLEDFFCGKFFVAISFASAFMSVLRFFLGNFEKNCVGFTC